MLDKLFFESFLRLNNVSAHASAVEIKTLLTQAHWPKEEIEEALLLSNTNGPVSAAPLGAHEQVFRPDMDWSSSKLSSLLGIDVVIDPKTFRLTEEKERVANTGKKILIGLAITLVALAIAAGIGLGLLYFFKIGQFHTHTQNII